MLYNIAHLEFRPKCIAFYDVFIYLSSDSNVDQTLAIRYYQTVSDELMGDFCPVSLFVQYNVFGVDVCIDLYPISI